MSNSLVHARDARLPWKFRLFAFTTFTETRFFHDFYAEKELEGSLLLNADLTSIFLDKKVNC